MRPVVALSDIPPPVPIKISRNVPPPPAKPPPPANTFADDDGEVQMRPVALSESPAAAGPVVPKTVSGKAPPPPIPYVEIPEEQMCENILIESQMWKSQRMLIEAMMSPEGFRYIMSPEGYQYIMSQPPPTPEIAQEVMMQRMHQDGLERLSTAMMSPEGYQWMKAQPVIAPSETPGSPPHSLVEPAPSTGPLAGGLEMLPHSPSPWSRLDTRLDASLERLDRIEEEWGILVNTDDYGDDAKAMEDCFRPHNYKKAHRANPRPPPPTHTSKSFKQTNRSGFQVAFSKIKLRVSSFNFQVSTSKQRSGSGFQVAISKFLVQTKLHVRVSSCNFQVSSFKPRSRSVFQVAISKF